MEWKPVVIGDMGEVLGVVYKAEAEARLKDRTAERDAIDMALGQEHREKLDLESRLAAAERDGKEAVDELAGENTEHMNRIAALEIKLADAKAIAQSRSEALDEQEKRWGAKLRELQYNQPSGDGKGGMGNTVSGEAEKPLLQSSAVPAPETPEGKTFRDCDTCIKVECHLRGYRGTAVCRPLRK